MPWLHVTTSGGPTGTGGLAEELAREVAAAAGLPPDPVEREVAAAARRVVAEALECAEGAVGVMRN